MGKLTKITYQLHIALIKLIVYEFRNYWVDCKIHMVDKVSIEYRGGISSCSKIKGKSIA